MPGWTSSWPAGTSTSFDGLRDVLRARRRRARRRAARGAAPRCAVVHLQPRQAEAAEPPIAGPSFDSIRLCAERSASLTAASTMSSSSSGSSGSIAFGSILISLISPPPVALTVTIPPPADASTVSFFSSSWACCICACICCDLLHHLVQVHAHSSAHLARVEGFLHQLDDLFLARRLVLRRLVALAAVLADLEGERELAARHLVERLREQRRVLRLLGELAVEEAARGNSTVSVSSARPIGCASRSTDAVGIDFSSTAGRIVRCQASWSCSSSSDGPARGRLGGVVGDSHCVCHM